MFRPQRGGNNFAYRGGGGVGGNDGFYRGAPPLRGRGGRGRGRGRGGVFSASGEEHRGEEYFGGEVQNGEHHSHHQEEEYQGGHGGAAWPPRPLTRVMARARTTSEATKGAAEPYENAYRIEVNEFMPRTASPGSAIPCVTVRDMRTFIPDKRQRRAYVPVAVAGELCKCLNQCRQAASEKGEKGHYDVSKLPTKTFQCPISKKKVEIERVTETPGEQHVSTRLRTYMDVPEKEHAKEDDFVEVIELRNELLGHLVKFLEDVATRYRPLTKDMNIPSLYSYSGERRFYYDLRETRWGVRLHISQVTGMYRNVVGIPLESVVAFRDRINQAIQFLGLEEKSESPTLGARQEEERSGGSRPFKNSGGRKRGGRGRGRGGRGSAQDRQSPQGAEGNSQQPQTGGGIVTEGTEPNAGTVPQNAAPSEEPSHVAGNE